MMDRSGRTEFLGYDTEEAEGLILAIVKDGEPRHSAASAGDTVQILDQPDAFLCRIRRPGGR